MPASPPSVPFHIDNSPVDEGHPGNSHDGDHSTNPSVHAISIDDSAPKAIDSENVHTQCTRCWPTEVESAAESNRSEEGSDASLDHKKAARAQARHERQRYDQYCTLVNLTLDRLSAAASQPHYATDDFRSLRAQLSDDVRTVVEQLNVLHQNGEETLRVPPGLWPAHETAARHVNTAAAVSPYGGLGDPNPPVVEEYIRRAGDASIASERLAELEYALAMEQARGLSESVLEHERAAQERRQELEAELRSALRDTAVLERSCIAQGHDPEQARYRWSE
ncbi:hypothetical protein LTR53_005361 [Teratosphaeriaceae sp. CCFEE 6253]|nr:hypothetical protein LTR53_005361 [Teratosphaeriaceae sp. CCFEE 6253]